MKRLYTTFSGHAYDEATGYIVRRAPKMGADEVRVYDDAWLMQQEFYRMNDWLWRHKGPKNLGGGRGFGWFAWKPFIILDCMDRFMQDGDIVLYTDGDTYPIHDFSMLYEECKRIGGVMLFAASGWTNRPWFKRDTGVVMAQDHPKYHDAEHAVGRFMLFQKGVWAGKQLLMEWLTYCVNPLANTMDPSKIKPEIDGFQESRTEQLILSLLAAKYGHKLYREACQFGETHAPDKDLYPTLFHQEGSHGDRRNLSGSSYRNV
jgi:hypothetical protein